MILPHPQDALHKVQMYRILIGILDEKTLSQNLLFKGGTAAAMLGFLDRFSIDLDFDLSPTFSINQAKIHLRPLFAKLELTVDSESQKSPFFIVQYPQKKGLRNSLKIGITPNPPKANIYKPQYLSEIDRYALCQTKETMFANKLVSLIDRYEKHQSIAGRDVYDIHYFFSHGFNYNQKVILERRRTSVLSFFKTIKDFIQKKITEKIITEDLNYLLPYTKFQSLRKTLKPETLFLINDQIQYLKKAKNEK